MRVKLGILDYCEFVKENDREPSKEEFMALGYSRSWYYDVKKNYRRMKEQEAKEAIDKAMAAETFKNKI